MKKNKKGVSASGRPEESAGLMDPKLDGTDEIALGDMHMHRTGTRGLAGAGNGDAMWSETGEHLYHSAAYSGGRGLSSVTRFY